MIRKATRWLSYTLIDLAPLDKVVMVYQSMIRTATEGLTYALIKNGGMEYLFMIGTETEPAFLISTEIGNRVSVNRAFTHGQAAIDLRAYHGNGITLYDTEGNIKWEKWVLEP